MCVLLSLPGGESLRGICFPNFSLGGFRLEAHTTNPDLDFVLRLSNLGVSQEPELRTELLEGSPDPQFRAQFRAQFGAQFRAQFRAQFLSSSVQGASPFWPKGGAKQTPKEALN